MMPEHEFCDDCPGCRPAIASFDPKTGQVGPKMPDDTPIMQAVNKYWDNDTTYEERHAYIEVTLHNSRLPAHMERCQRVLEQLQRIMQEIDNG